MKSLIAAAMLLALVVPANAARKDPWSLVLNAWHCSTKGCNNPGKRYAEFVTKEAFATRKQCRARGRHLARIGRIRSHKLFTIKDWATMGPIYNENTLKYAMIIA